MCTAYSRHSAALLLLGLLALSGCSKDTGPEQLAKADGRYQELINQKVPPRDAAWTEVISQLEAVPRDSRSRPEADRRLASLKAAREQIPARPLARPGATGAGASEVETRRAACEALAKKLGGTTTEPGRDLLRKALEDCQAELVRLEANDHPPGEEGH